MLNKWSIFKYYATRGQKNAQRTFNMWYCSPGFLEGKSKMFYSPGELILD